LGKQMMGHVVERASGGAASASLFCAIAVLCPFVGSAVGSRCLTARGYKKEIEWVSERDGWSTFGILT
jgi:hypothetical protein